MLQTLLVEQKVSKKVFRKRGKTLLHMSTRNLQPIYGPFTHRETTMNVKKSGQRCRHLSVADKAMFVRLTQLELRGIYGLLTEPSSVRVHNVYSPSSIPNLMSPHTSYGTW